MKFYFYTNKNIMFDFLGRNLIAPDTIVKDIKRYRTIGTASDCFLFVTHKQLDRKSRENGIAEPEFVYPMTLELSDITDQDGNAVFVSESNNELIYSYEKLSAYNQDKHLGAYIIGEIPLSRIEKIYFDSQDDMDMFSRPSPDYWYPTDKYALLPESFNEGMLLKCEEEKIIHASQLNPDAVIKDIRTKEKKRAAYLNFFNGTRRWQYDKYVFNIDENLRELLNMNEEELVNVTPHYAEVKDRDNLEYLSLCGNPEENSGPEFNQIIYSCIYRLFIEQPYNTQKQVDQITQLLDCFVQKITSIPEISGETEAVKQSIVEIEKMITDSSNKDPEEIALSICESIDILKAVLFVVKNPNKYDIFLESLNAYHANVITKRRACVLWGALNGLYGMPGEGFNKDNQQLWQYIEYVVCNEGGLTGGTFVLESPEAKLVNDSILGIRLIEERIITANEVREAILSTSKAEYPNTFYSKLLEAAVADNGTKMKAENKGYLHHVASIDMPIIKAGDELNLDIKKKLGILERDLKNLVPNKEKIFKDYVESAEKFQFVFNLDASYWKRVLNTILEKRDEKL